ncbi:MAG: adenosylcobinamide-GDP ribazoletransferase [Desulfamplus sp.]|nr:adenosylcobinamide-GDP ribazoletransferase [Desulfamplus sp.]
MLKMKYDFSRAIPELRSAIMFITIIPAGKNVPFSPTGMIRFFPVVGLIIGALLICADTVGSLFWSAPVVALIDVLVLVILTGAFHLDGLGDAADGLFSHRSKERALEIMKDSRTGMMGLVAIFLSLAVKVAGIYSVKILPYGADVFLSNSTQNFFINFHNAAILLIIPSYSRASMLFGIRYFKYGRDKGTGYDLFEKRLPFEDFIFLLIPVLISLTLGIKCLIINGIFALTVFLIILFYKKKMGCITGDMLGAMCEVTESILFLFAGMAII